MSVIDRGTTDLRRIGKDCGQKKAAEQDAAYKTILIFSEKRI
ncbi:MAG: hypothetical protein ACLUUO_14445 [Sellimonas intestinalis]